MNKWYIIDKEEFAEFAIRVSQLYNAGLSIEEISERMQTSEDLTSTIITDCKIETLL